MYIICIIFPFLYRQTLCTELIRMNFPYGMRCFDEEAQGEGSRANNNQRTDDEVRATAGNFKLQFSLDRMNFCAHSATTKIYQHVTEHQRTCSIFNKDRDGIIYKFWKPDVPPRGNPRLFNSTRLFSALIYVNLNLCSRTLEAAIYYIVIATPKDISISWK